MYRRVRTKSDKRVGLWTHRVYQLREPRSRASAAWSRGSLYSAGLPVDHVNVLHLR